MEMVELTIQKREGTGKGSAGRLRRAGHVPAVLYGVGTPETIAVSPRDVLRLIHGHEGSTRLLKVAFPGSSMRRISVSSSVEARLLASACITSFDEEPPNARSIRSRMSCRCVCSSVNRDW